MKIEHRNGMIHNNSPPAGEYHSLTLNPEGRFIDLFSCVVISDALRAERCKRNSLGDVNSGDDSEESSSVREPEAT